MNSVKVVKRLGIYFLIGITVLNIYLYIQQKNKAKDITKIQNENVELKKDNEIMKEKVKLFSPTERELYYQSMIKATKTFIYSAYVQQSGDYKKRREDAKKIMSNDLLDRFFPTDTTYQDQIKTTIFNDQYFVQELQPDQDKVDVIVKFDHELDYIKTGNVDKNQIYVMVTFQREGDKWVAVKVQDINENSQ